MEGVKADRTICRGLPGEAHKDDGNLEDSDKRGAQIQLRAIKHLSPRPVPLPIAFHRAGGGRLPGDAGGCTHPRMPRATRRGVACARIAHALQNR
jgi:hypothetical protein